MTVENLENQQKLLFSTEYLQVIVLAILIFAILIFFILIYPFFVWIFRNIISRKIQHKNNQLIFESSRIRVLYELKVAVEKLSKKKIGAIITVERSVNLDNLRTDGIVLNADISSDLIISIFNKESPLHDGAIIIRGDKIYYAATYYKISSKSINNKTIGARHRAGMGISEVSDSFTIIVSEQNGDITFAINGLFEKIDVKNLQESLNNYLN